MGTILSLLDSFSLTEDSAKGRLKIHDSEPWHKADHSSECKVSNSTVVKTTYEIIITFPYSEYSTLSFESFRYDELIFLSVLRRK